MSGYKKIDVVDEDDNAVGKATWKEAHEKGLIFRAANVIMFNSKGMIFVHRRNRNLPTFAGMWDVKLGGIVDAGESYEEAARRELREEAGIRNAKLEFIFPLKFRKGSYRNNRKVYKCVYDGKMKLQESEIEEGRFVAVEEAKKMMREGMLSPSAVAVFEEFLKRKQSPHKVKAILFDLNGVLTKSDIPNWKEVRFTSKILGVRAKKSQSSAWRKIYLQLSSGKMSLSKYHSELEKIFGKKLPANFEEKFSSLEKAKEEGIPELLKKLKAKGCKIGVLTNYYHDWAFAALERIGALKYLDAVAVSSQIKARKPSAKAYLEAVKMLRCKLEECVYIGDSQDDLDGAVAVGLRTIFIPDKETKVVGHDKIRRLTDILRRF